MSRGRHRIVVTEVPYMTNKTTLLERIAKLARDEKVEGIADLRDESDRQGVRIVIELNKSANPDEALRDLYRLSSLSTTFSLIMLALVDGEPRLLNLKRALHVYLSHRLEIVRKRSEHDLKKARQREHILAGLMIALTNLDEIIDVIRRSRNVETARQNLRKRFKFSAEQTEAILNMPLRRLAALERKKIEDEHKAVKARIRSLVALLKSPKKMRQVIADEMNDVKEKFNDRRRTQIIAVSGTVDQAPVRMSSLTPDETVWVSVMPNGKISRSLSDQRPRLSGSGAPAWVIKTNTRDTLYLVSTQGEAASLPVHSVPKTAKTTNGTHFAKVSPLRADDTLAAIFTLPPKANITAGWFVLTVTQDGMIKKTALEELPGPAATTFTLVRVNSGDNLGWIQLSLDPGNHIIGVALLPQKGEVFLLASNGRAKRVVPNDFPTQGRHGKGVIAWKLPDGVKLVGCTVGKASGRITLHLKKYAAKFVNLKDARLQTRAAATSSFEEFKIRRSVNLAKVLQKKRSDCYSLTSLSYLTITSPSIKSIILFKGQAQVCMDLIR
jgi:DNA gyrase subunit A